MKFTKIVLLALGVMTLTQCNTTLKDQQAIAARESVIAQEAKGNYYIGRRYHVPATRFWGYLREPGQSWRTAKLVILDESAKLAPDRYPEDGQGLKYAYDNNYEYKIYGKYTGKEAYEPNTNLKLPVFKLTGYQLVNAQPGWLFKPSEVSREDYVSLRPAIMPPPLQEKKL
jgi:hypothetical protein